MNSRADKALRLYIVVGESSGDSLGASIMDELSNRNIEVEVGGLAGPMMMARGANSLFDISQLSLMGFTAILAKLPSLMKLVRQTVEDVDKFNPDLVLLIDSPEFGYAVAKRLKKRLPRTKIVKYICPSVWAWRPGRAAKMKRYLDHVLAILPFEPDVLKELGGPSCTYVGHPLAQQIDKNTAQKTKTIADRPKLLLLPGSRRNEISKLLPVFSNTLDLLADRGNEFQAVLPAVAHLEDEIREQVSKWRHDVKIVVGEEAKLDVFKEADLALGCSGTVMLELGIHSIPSVSVYKTDKIGFFLRYLVKIWSANLVNLITDRVVIPERLDEYARPEYIARLLERLMVEGPEREAQLAGFASLREKMLNDQDQQGLAVDTLLKVAGR